jgi:hypothetical protein
MMVILFVVRLVSSALFSNAYPFRGNRMQLLELDGLSDVNLFAMFPCAFKRLPGLICGGLLAKGHTIVFPVVPADVVTVAFAITEVAPEDVVESNIPGIPVNIIVPASGLALVIVNNILVASLPVKVVVAVVNAVADAPPANCVPANNVIRTTDIPSYFGESTERVKNGFVTPLGNVIVSVVPVIDAFVKLIAAPLSAAVWPGMVF